MAYTTENHSKYLLLCHLIFVCKYRKKLLLTVGNDIISEIETIAAHYNWHIIEQERDQDIDQDHINILIRYPPKWSILEIVRLLKQLTTYRIWKQHEEYLPQHFWKERTFWSDGYFHVASEMLAKKSFRNIFKDKEDRAYIP